MALSPSAFLRKSRCSTSWSRMSVSQRRFVGGHARIGAVDDHGVEGGFELLERIGVVEDADVALAEVGGERSADAEVGKDAAGDGNGCGSAGPLKDVTPAWIVICHLMDSVLAVAVLSYGGRSEIVLKSSEINARMSGFFRIRDGTAQASRRSRGPSRTQVSVTERTPGDQVHEYWADCAAFPVLVRGETAAADDPYPRSPTLNGSD